MDPHDSDDAREAETTPLLASSQRNEQRSDGEQSVAEEPVSPQRPSLSRIRRFMYVGIATSLVIGTIAMVLLVAETFLSAHGHNNYRFYDDWSIVDNCTVLVWTWFFGSLMGAVNIIRLKRTGKPLGAALNVLCFGISAFCILTVWGQCLQRRSSRAPKFCKGYDWNEEPWTPDRMDKCQKWAVKYQAVFWTIFALVGLYGILLAVLFIAVLVDVHRNRQTSDTTVGTNSRFTLPAGQVSVEVTFRWGRSDRQEFRNSQEAGGHREIGPHREQREEPSANV